MFSKSAKPQPQANDISHNFFGKYYGVGNLYTIIQGQREQRVRAGKISFLTEKKDFDFKICVASRDPAKPNDKFLFPVNPDMKICCKIDKDAKTVSYVWVADQSMSLEIEFQIVNEDFDDSIKFRNVVVRLIYQVSTRKPFSELKETAEFEKFCPIKDSAEGRTPPEVLAAFQQLIVSPDVEFASVGELLSLDPNQPSQDPFVIDSNFIFLVRGLGNYTYEIQISKNFKFLN